MGAENRTVDVYDLSNSSNIRDIHRALARAIKLSIRTHIPSTLVTYDPARQRAIVTVDALPVVKVTDPTRIPKNILTLKGVPPNAEAILQPITLTDIPVAQDGGLLNWSHASLNPGDPGLLHVSDRSLDAWLLAGIPTDPIFAFTHALKDSVFYPGVRPSTKPLVPPPPTGYTIQGTPFINLGPLAADNVVLATKLLAALTAAITATVTVPQDGGASFKATLLAQLALILPATIGSVKVKAEP